jgi:hypothetical protein
MGERKALLVRMGPNGHAKVDALNEAHKLKSKSEAARLALAFAFSRPEALAKFVEDQKRALAAAANLEQVPDDSDRSGEDG